jgi:hypothetical protein
MAHSSRIEFPGAFYHIAKLVGLAGARASGEALSCSLFAEGSRQGLFFRFALYLDRSRDAQPLPRALTGHVAHPLRCIDALGSRLA